MKKQKVVYHGSSALVKELIPKQAKDENKSKENNLKAVYASAIKEEAIVMGICSCEGVKRSSVGIKGKKVKVKMEGFPKQEYFYLYTLPLHSRKAL